jgi:ribulose kinase
MDARPDQASAHRRSGHPALKYNGYGNVSAEWMPCKLLWLKENEPETYREAGLAGSLIG